MADETLAARWRTGEGDQLALEVFDRLLAGKPLADLGLGQYDGRVDLRGIPAPAPHRLENYNDHRWAAERIGGLLTFRGVKLTGLDLSWGRLESFRIVESTIANCRFNEARCGDWRLWAVDVTDSSFSGADMRKAVLGPWYEGRGNVFRKVNFNDSDLREIVCPTATFVECDFSNARLAKVDFQSSSFVRCRFAGPLRDVMFYAHGFKTLKPDPNPMEDVDFSGAELRMVEFRGLDLDRVSFPVDAEHLIVHHYRCVLDHAIRELADDPKWRGLRAVLQSALKWAGPRQQVGVFNRLDFVELANEEEADFALSLLRRIEDKCARN
jgi:uncharacterized protein YjbI with pentapeptide repeats